MMLSVPRRCIPVRSSLTYKKSSKTRIIGAYWSYKSSELWDTTLYLQGVCMEDLLDAVSSDLQGGKACEMISFFFASGGSEF